MKNMNIIMNMKMNSEYEAGCDQIEYIESNNSEYDAGCDLIEYIESNNSEYDAGYDPIRVY